MKCSPRASLPSAAVMTGYLISSEMSRPYSSPFCRVFSSNWRSWEAEFPLGLVSGTGTPVASRDEASGPGMVCDESDDIGGFGGRRSEAEG